jgi:FKBP-type peptidyl-prolyl cis-trans isomerase FklB
MKKVVCWVACGAIALMSVSTVAKAEKSEKKAGAVVVAKKAEKKSAFTNNIDKVSYAIGFQFGKDFKNNDVVINPDVFLRGLQDGSKEKFDTMTLEEIKETLMNFQKEMIAKQEKTMKDLGQKNLIAAKTFMEANAKKEGVKSLPDGLQYKIIKEGTGPVPQPTDKVKIHYTGKLTDGKEFDSSVKRNEPLEVPVTGGTITGMSEALKMMKVGSKWELFIPPSLGYGERPGRVIPPNSVLIFEVELLSIAKDQPAKLEIPAPSKK